MNTGENKVYFPMFFRSVYKLSPVFKLLLWSRLLIGLFFKSDALISSERHPTNINLKTLLSNQWAFSGSKKSLCKPWSYYKLGTDGISPGNGFWRTFSFGMLAMDKVTSNICCFRRLNLLQFFLFRVHTIRRANLICLLRVGVEKIWDSTKLAWNTR